MSDDDSSIEDEQELVTTREDEYDDDPPEKTAKELALEREKLFKSALKTLYGRHKEGAFNNLKTRWLGGVNWASGFIATLSYYYVIILTISSIMGPYQNLWVPMMGVYTFYPMGILIGGYVGYVWTHEVVFLACQVLGSICGLGLSLLYIIEWLYQIDHDGGFESVIHGNQTTKYPPTSQSFNLTGSYNGLSSRGATVRYNYAYINLQFILNCANFFFCFMSMAFSLGASCWLGGDDKALPNQYNASKYEFKLRFFVSTISIFLVFLTMIGFSIASVLQAGYGWILLSLFSDQNTLLLMMMTLSIYVPIGDRDLEPILNEDGDEITPDEEHIRYHSGFDEKGMNFFCGWVIAIILSFSTLFYNIDWRNKNGMPSTACGNTLNYTKYLGNDTSPGEPLVYFAWQTVTYEPKEPSSASQSVTFTCVDDVATLTLLSFGLMIFVLSAPIAFYACAPCRKDVQKVKAREERRQFASNNAKIEEANKVSRVSLDRVIWRSKRAKRTEALGKTPHIPLNEVSYPATNYED